MKEENNLLVIGSGAAPIALVTRRRMVRRLLAGAGAAWPLVVTSHPIYALLSDDAILDKAAKLADTDWRPAFLSLQQIEVLTTLAESVVPGSTRAQASRFIDLLLRVDRPENRREFLESLTALDAEAQKRFGKGFPALDREQKNALLSDVSRKPESPKAFQTEASKKPPTLYDHFENLKGWISGAYYSSELGMRELGWTGDYVFEKFSGCVHPDGHH